MIPLAIYGLDHPKIGVADRFSAQPQSKEARNLRRALNDVIGNILSVSNSKSTVLFWRKVYDFHRTSRYGHQSTDTPRYIPN
jgi:hypothetical protein